MNGAGDLGRLRVAWGSISGVDAPVERLARRWLSRCRRWAPVVLSLSVVATLVIAELRSSWLSSRVLSALGRRLSVQLHAGASGPPLQAPHGPYDERLGYAQLPDFLPRLSARGFEVVGQARASPSLAKLAAAGVFPAYHEKSQAGLSLVDRRGQPLFTTRYPVHAYQRMEDIPPVVVRTLLYIENRELLEAGNPSRNPAIEWDRLARAVFDMGLHAVDSGHPVSGGSTLATQLAKLRHSPHGRTVSAADKGRQMIAASLKVYLDGPNTVDARRRIVRDYLNSLPLGAIAGHGEVTGLGDGLWAWFGADVDVVNRVLCDASASGTDDRHVEEQARAYREVLMLLLAIKKPSVYFPHGVAALDRRVDSYFGALVRAGVISPALGDAALRVRVAPRQQVPLQAVRFVEQKATDGVRRLLLSMLGLSSPYDLDRLDLSVRTTLDGGVTERVTSDLQRLAAPSSVAAAGFTGPHLLSRGNPAGITYSFTMYERGLGANLLRVQADTFNGPLDVSQGTRLELGSTAKLRTLVTYLEVVTTLHARYAEMTLDALQSAPMDPRDPLGRWAVDYLRRATDRSLPAMLEAAMTRRYSASPGEAFFTGGGLHHFANYERDDSGRVLTVREAFRRSVNLVFIRLMRDVVHYYTFGDDSVSSNALRTAVDPARRQYLERFADQEGQTFLRRFYLRYEGQTPEEALETLIRAHHPSPKRLAVMYRSVQPEASLDQFAAFLRSHMTGGALARHQTEALYRTSDPSRLTLNDRGYLARVHPLELWLIAYQHHHPDATLSAMIAASARERQGVYAWLFKTRDQRAQNVRIQTLFEREAFERIHRDWQRLGYPFPSLVPSYATAIGSSGDTPAALAELVGVLLNEGIRYPSVRVEQLRFGEGTPFETVLESRSREAQRVLPREVAAVVTEELFGVVHAGTGRRLARGLDVGERRMLPVGGKTGTGDNRFSIRSSAGRRLLVLGRTATFVFILGDRFFGALTAYVSGKEAMNYAFTSALPVELLRRLGPTLRPLLDEPDRASDAIATGRSRGLVKTNRRFSSAY